MIRQLRQATVTHEQTEHAATPLWMQQQNRFVRIILWVIMIILAVIMIFPFFYVIMISISSQEDIINGGLFLLPRQPTLEAYVWLWNAGTMLRAFGISVLVTLSATLFDLLLTTTFAYGLSVRTLPGRKALLWVVLFTMLVNAGLIPNFLLVRQLGMLDSLLALIIPAAISGFNVIVLRQFFLNIPQELLDSARIDGANDFQILWRVILPLSKAALAVIALFLMVSHWNSFFSAIIYLSNPEQYPLATLLRTLVLQGNTPADVLALNAGSIPPPSDALTMAAVVITTLPILLVYPFLQKHFTKGVLTGSIKG